MIVLIAGLVLIIVGALSLNFAELVTALKDHDPQQWQLLGSPPPHAFSKTLGVFSWVLSGAYRRSASDDVQTQGDQAYQRARRARGLMLCGAILLAAGLVLAIGNINS